MKSLRFIGICIKGMEFPGFPQTGDSSISTEPPSSRSKSLKKDHLAIASLKTAGPARFG